MYNSILLGAGAVNNFIADGIEYDICIDGLIDLDNRYYKVPSNPIISSSQSRGLSSYWHGLIPLNSHNYFSIEKYFFINRLNKFYKIDNKLIDKNYIFVPRFQPSFRINNIVKDHIISIECIKNFFVINGFYKKYYTKKLYLGLGAYTSSRIYNRIYGVNSNIGKDQICGYLGNIKASNLLKYISPQNIISSNGHLIPYYLEKNNEYILMFRPASFDFNFVENTYNCRTSFNSGTTDIIKRLSKFKSLGLVNEALYNKFGLAFKSDYYNIYYQSGKSVDVSMEKCFHLDGYQSSLIANSIFENISKTMPEINFSEINFSPALHLHSTIVNYSPINNLLITDPSILINIGPYHHTFLTATKFLFNNE